MNESTIENLFAAVQPVPDAASTAGSRTREDSGEFGDRLRQAAAPPAEPWWRASPNRSESDQRSSAGPPPLPNRAFKPTKDQSPPTQSDANSDSSRSSSAKLSDRFANRDDSPTHDADKSSTDSSTPAAAASATAKPAPAKPDAADKPTNDEPQAAKIDTATAQKADATTAVSLPVTDNDSPSAVADKSTTAAKDAVSSHQEILAATQQSIVSADDSKPDASVANVATQPIQQPGPPTLTTAVATTETPTAAASTPKPVVDAVSAKKSDAKAATDQRSTPKSKGQADISPVQRLSAVQTNSDGAQPNTAAVVATATTDQKSSAKQDPSPANDKSAADQSQQAAPIPINSNQPAPVVAAVTTAIVSGQTIANNGNADAGQKTAKVSGPPNNATLAAFSRVDRGSGSLTAGGPRQAGDDTDMPSIDPARFISRVAKAIETAQERGGPLNLRLSPPELGSMRIQLDVKQGVLTAKVETDTAAARQALLDNLPTLRARLAEHNVRIDRFDVDVRRDGTGDQATPGRQHQQYQQQYNQTSVPRVASAAPPAGEDVPADPAPLDRIITNTTINLVA
jgi:flagellar hook-length control protein FliK